MSATDHIDTICDVLAFYRFNYADEVTLQNGIELALDRAGIANLREYRLSAKDRPDFFCDGICIECKVGGSLSSLIRQIHRYVQHDEVAGVVIVTNRSNHSLVPDVLTSKPVRVHSLLLGGL